MSKASSAMMVAIMSEGSHPRLMKSGPASHKRHPAIHLPIRESATSGACITESSPVASGGELGHAPLEPSSVLAEPVGCACHNEPAHELRPVGSELQGERATCRDAEHVERPAELVFDRLGVVVGEVSHLKARKKAGAALALPFSSSSSA